MGLFSRKQPDEQQRSSFIMDDDGAYELLRWMAKEREKAGLWSRSEEEDAALAYGEDTEEPRKKFLGLF